MATIVAAAAAVLMVLAGASAARAADAGRGRTLFVQQCGGCHLAAPGDGDGGQGPSLAGVVGRKVGGDPDFSYSPALAGGKDIWTEAGLADFLENPQAARPGSLMPARVPAAADRADIAAYLARTKAQSPGLN